MPDSTIHGKEVDAGDADKNINDSGKPGVGSETECHQIELKKSD